MTVTVTYNLSAAGQKAALLAGRTATSRVVEEMEFSDAALIDKLIIEPSGKLTFRAVIESYYSADELYFDSPPADLAQLIAATDERKELVRLRLQEKEQVAKAERDAQAAERAARHALDLEIVDAIVADVEAIPVDSPLPNFVNVSGASLYGIRSAGRELNVTPEQKERITAVLKVRDAHRIAKEAAEKEQKRIETEAMIAERGGIVFPAPAGMCNFLGRGLWSGGQSKRWVGRFTGAKGIDDFLRNPKGEFTYEISTLGRGDCIQGAGYDTKSNGKRRNESEWFGVVVAVANEEIVIDLCDSRAEALKSSAQIRKADKAEAEKVAKAAAKLAAKAAAKEAKEAKKEVIIA